MNATDSGGARRGRLKNQPTQTTVVVEDDGTLGRYDVGEDDAGKLNECHRLPGSLV